MPDFQSGITNLFNMIGFAATQDPVRKLKAEQKQKQLLGTVKFNDMLNLQAQTEALNQKELEKAGTDPQAIMRAKETNETSTASAYELTKNSLMELTQTGNPQSIRLLNILDRMPLNAQRAVIANLNSSNSIVQNNQIRDISLEELNWDNIQQYSKNTYEMGKQMGYYKVSKDSQKLQKHYDSYLNSETERDKLQLINKLNGGK